jgi:hypothetical protein
MLHKAETHSVYWEQKQIGTIRKAHIENMQENLVPGVSPLEIVKNLGGTQTVFVTMWKNRDIEWKDVFKFLKIKIFKLFNIKSSLDRLFIKKKKDIILNDWFQECLNNNYNGKY